MGELNSGLKHQLSGTDSESHIYYYPVPLGYKTKGEVDCGYLAQYNLAYSWRVGVASLGSLTM